MGGIIGAEFNIASVTAADSDAVRVNGAGTVAGTSLGIVEAEIPPLWWKLSSAGTLW